MKKLSLALLVLSLLAPELFALRPGDNASELYNVIWLANKPGKLLNNSQDRAEAPSHKLLTFMLVHSPNVPETLKLAGELSAHYGKKLPLIFISPDPESDVRQLLQNFPAQNWSCGIDPGRQLTRRYMGASLLYPLSFLIDKENKIVWFGEFSDAPEALERLAKGKLNPDVEKKLAPLVDELQTLLRQNNPRRMRLTARKIFELDPTHPAALRQMLFALENTDRIPEAQQLLQERLAAAPDIARLYFITIEFLQRNLTPQTEQRLQQVLAQFEKNITSPSARYFMAYQLLRGYFMNPVTFSCAARLVQTPLPEAKPEKIAALLCRAVVSKECGKLDQALQEIAAAETLNRQLDEHQKNPQISHLKKYVETLKKLRDR